MHQCAWIQVSCRRGSIISIVNPHRPQETNFWNEVVEHDGKNNTAQAGASRDNTVRKASSQVVMQLTAGVKRQLIPIGLQIRCERRI